MPREAEAAGRQVIIIRWQRPGEALADPTKVNHHGHA
jgi:hypothetical protein